jgi:1-phosphofructokinase
MIVTVTPNPSVDRTFEVATLERGQVLRALSSRVDAGGKGINVARALHANGHRAAAVVPIGGPEGAHLLHLLDGTGLEVISVPIGGSVRSNVTIVELDGTNTKLNEPGPTLTTAELDALLAASTDVPSGTRWLVASGSLPPEAPADLLARIVRRARAAGVATAVDTSGPALAAAVAAGPDLVKPNADELAELTGRPLLTLGDVIDAAGELCERGAGSVLASLGPDGALLVTGNVVAHAELAVATPNSTVGAGDATLAGYLTAADEPLAGLRAAVAFGAAAVSLPGSQMPGPSDLHPAAVEVHDRPDRGRLLSSPVPEPHGVPTLTDTVT